MSNFRRSNVQGGAGRRIRLNPDHEIANDFSNRIEELNQDDPPITAEYVGPGLTRQEYENLGFDGPGPNDRMVDSLDKANYIKHVDVDGNVNLYRAASFRKTKINYDELLDSPDRTDEPSDPEDQIKTQREALAKGGRYMLIYRHADKKSRTGGAFCYFLKEDFPTSLSHLGIYKLSEWNELSDIEIFNSCLVHCFKDHRYGERLQYSKASVYTLLSKKVFENICDTIESNIDVHVISEDKNKKKKNGVFQSHDRVYKYNGKDNKKYEETFRICLLMGHYFPFIEETGYTSKYIKKCVWKDPEKDPKKLRTKYGLYESKTTPLNSFNLVKTMIEQMDDYFEPFTSQILKEPRKEKLDEKVLFKDYEQFDVDYDCKENTPFNDKVKDDEEIVEVLEEDEEIEDDEEYINNILSEIEVNNNSNIIQDIYHCDIETSNHRNKHVPYLMAYYHNDYEDKKVFYGKNCIKSCLTHICKKYIKEYKIDNRLRLTLKFQNLGYDIRFIRNELHYITKSVEPSKNKVYELYGVYNLGKNIKVNIKFADQYPQIPMKLDSYKKAFNLEEGKYKDFPHFFYNNKTDYRRTLKCPISMYEELNKHFPKEYIRKSLDGKYLILEHIKYAEDYCLMDVKTQRDGWRIMHKNVLEQTGLDYNSYMTISNLSKAYCRKEGCYNGVNLIRGKTNTFIRKCVVGGRTMGRLHHKKNPGVWILNEEECDEDQNGFNYDYEDEDIKSEKEDSKFIFYNLGSEFDVTYNQEPEKIKKNPKRKDVNKKEIIYENKFISTKKKKINGIRKRLICGDINSLYPFAIFMLLGYPIGKVKNIPIKDLKSKKFIKYANEYYLKIKILKVNKKLDFPLLTKIGEKGERIWTNDMEGEEIYIDRITLEELIKYHDIEYECKVGVMFNEGYNTKIKEVVHKLYELRNKYKKENNPIQLVYKLMLNTIYGKTIQKPKDSEILWRKDSTTCEENLIRTFGESIQYISKPEDGKKLFKVKIRIGIVDHWSMPHCGSLVLSQSKRVMNNFLAEYGEWIYYTDTDSIFIDEEKFLEIKNLQPELFGDELGQLKEENHLSGDCVRIIKAMFLAPKVYWIREENEEGEIYDKVTMKGIPNSAIDYVVRQKFNGNVETLFYALIKRKKGVLFDLTNGGDTVRMDFNSLNDVFNVDLFSRRLGGFK